MIPRLQLRFVERDGKRILQQRYVGIFSREPETVLEVVFGGKIEAAQSPWQDVPTEQEEEK